VQGTVNTIGLDSFSLQTREGRTVMVEARGVDRRAVQGIRPGDVVTVTGQAETPDRFVAQSIRMDQRGR
jgi:translation initiation factor IF-1